jgi:hypothetical protein
MSVCALCGHPTFGADGLCTYHSTSHGDDWALGNRIMCDFLHRGIVTPTPARNSYRSVEAMLDGLELEPALAGADSSHGPSSRH